MHIEEHKSLKTYNTFAIDCTARYFASIQSISDLKKVLKSKIHRVTVTNCDLNYIGSITIDETLLDAAKMIPGEKVQVVNINNGERLETYIIKGKKGSGEVTLNGPAARKAQKGDKVIIISYARMSLSDAKMFNPALIFPNNDNILM